MSSAKLGYDVKNRARTQNTWHRARVAGGTDFTSRLVVDS
jgi:hypothetical protein